MSSLLSWFRRGIQKHEEFCRRYQRWTNHCLDDAWNLCICDVFRSCNIWPSRRYHVSTCRWMSCLYLESAVSSAPGRNTTFRASLKCTVSPTVYRARPSIPLDDDWRGLIVFVDNSEYVGLNWSSISPDLMKAPIYIIRFSQLNALDFRCMSGIPKDIFQGPKFKHLSFSKSTVSSSRSLDTYTYSLVPADGTSPLESLRIDSSISLADIGLVINLESGTPSLILPNLASLSIVVQTENVLYELRRALSNAPSL